MLGAIAGDIIGSVYEWEAIKTTDFPLFSPPSVFTDDTVLTVAVADAILNNRPYGEMLKQYGRARPNAGYGAGFMEWLLSEVSRPYNSWGNGSAMRVSPVGFAFDSQERVLQEAGKSAAVTHNHPEGIKGAQATALAIFLARQGEGKEHIKMQIEDIFSYDLSRWVDDIRPGYRFNESCQGTVPEAIICFLEAADFEDAVRNAVSLGGDSDTLACITGGIAEAYYGSVPEHISREVYPRLPQEFIRVVREFRETFGC